MKVFGLDTTRKIAKIFIDNDGKTSVFTMDEKIKHSEGLFLYIEKSLFDCGLKFDDFDYLCSVVGPGSFTGIRVGMSTIKGINKVINKKIIPFNMFEVLSFKCKDSVILLNSTNTSCYYARVKHGEVLDTGVVDKNKIVENFNGLEFVVLKEEQNLIDLEYNNIRYVEDVSENYFKVLQSKLNEEKFDDFVPYYLQLSQAERNLKNE